MIDGEEKIIKNAIKGRAEAFGLLYDHYQPQIYRFIYLKVSHREEAEDLTHQVFLKTWQSIADYEHQGLPFSGWLYRVARNLIIDYYRSQKSIFSLENENISLTEKSLDDQLDMVLDTERVKSAVRQLSSEYQDVIILRFVEDFSPKETAIAMDKSESSVKLLQHRAIKNLKKILSKER